MSLDLTHFEHLAELYGAGRYEDVIRESRILLAETTDADERASLLVGVVGSYSFLGRLEEARQTLGQARQLDLTDVGTHLSLEFSGAYLLIQEKKLEEGVAAFATILQRHSEALKEPRFRYMYEDIQSRRALALAELARYTEALPILAEAVSFSFEKTADEQEMRYWLGLCFDETKDSESARAEFVRVISFGLKNDIEEHARYRLAIICFMAHGFAQARQQLETILRDRPDGNFVVAPKDVYQVLSQICRQLGDTTNEKLYMDLAKKRAEKEPAR
jgi:tetratricopeptide (TPR) repeat protein